MIFGVEKLSATPAIRLPRPTLLLRAMQPAPRRRVKALDGWFSEAIAEYHFQITGEVKVLPGSARNETWFLPTTDGNKVLKRYKASLDLHQIQFEHELLRHLEKKSFPAPRLVQTAQGKTIVEKDHRRLAVWDYLDGYYRYDGYYFFPAQDCWYLTEIGRSLSALHDALRDFVPASVSSYGFQSLGGNRARDLNWHLETLHQNRVRVEKQPQKKADPTNQLMLGLMKDIEACLVETDTMLTAAHLDRRIIHGDYGPYNLLIRAGAPVAVVDFEISRPDWRLMDLVSACSSTISRNYHESALKQIQTIAAGYQSLHPLENQELALLPVTWQFQLTRRIVLCWTRYLDEGKTCWADEIQKRVLRLNWVEQHQKTLAHLTGNKI